MRQSNLITSSFLLLMLSSVSLLGQSANMRTAMDGYAKFGAGDIPGIIAYAAPEIIWVHDGDPDIIPFAGEFHGAAGMGNFFELVGQSVKISEFKPYNFRETGNQVTNDCHIEGIVIATGKHYADEVVMTWTFGDDGKVLRWEAKGSMAGITTAAKSN